MNNYVKSTCSILTLVILTIYCCSVCFALDDPDGPDRVAVFEEKSKFFEKRIQEHARNDQEIVLAYQEYEKFLDEALNQTYATLMQRLNEPSRQNLLASQRQWLRYRDAEFLFVSTTWTLENFGSSSSVSRGGFRTAILRDRVVGLLHYLQNYGEIKAR